MPEGEPPSISFIIPVRDDAARLERCLQSIQRNELAAKEIIVADNGSVDGSDRVASEAGAVVLHLPGLKVSELRNRAVQQARGRVLAFIDADHEIDASWAQTALATLDEEAGPAAVGAVYRPPDPATWVQRMYDALRQPGRADVGWLPSGNLAIRRTAFEAVAGFDTTLETCEDVDLCQRLQKGGYHLRHDDRLRSVHHGDPRTLRDLFFGELWRGRDNVRVSLRALSLRGLPSILIPVIDLVCLVTALVGVVTLTYLGLAVAGAAAGTVIVLAMLRAVRMLRRHGSCKPIMQALAVALVYDLARSLALVGGASHRRRRGGKN